MRNRNALREYIDAHGNNRRDAIADAIRLIERRTGDTLSEKSFYAWLNGTRPCPGWVLYVLRAERTS